MISSNSSQYRYERKFLVSSLSREAVESIIRVHPAMFREIFHQLYPREIRHSLGEFYTPDWMVQHIVNQHSSNLKKGVILDPTCGSRRKKVRVSWYNNLFGKVAEPVIEIKLKNGELGRKVSHGLEPFRISQGADLTSVCDFDQDLLSSSLPGVRSLVPTLLNRYSRRYFISND